VSYKDLFFFIGAVISFVVSYKPVSSSALGFDSEFDLSPVTLTKFRRALSTNNN
jgi:hypothetical protein